MLQLRRATAVLLNLLLLQAGLVGYGAGCGQHDDVASAATNTPAMVHGGDASHGTNGACREIASADACSLPVPGGCAMVTACAVLAIPARTSLAFADAPSAGRAWGDPALAHPAPRPAPDLPPPRA